MLQIQLPWGRSRVFTDSRVTAVGIVKIPMVNGATNTTNDTNPLNPTRKWRLTPPPPPLQERPNPFSVYSDPEFDYPTVDLVVMGKYCLIEVELGVICSCMPSLPVLFRPLIHRLTGKHNGSNTKTTGYVGASSRRAVMDNTKPSATKSASSYPEPSPRAHQAAYYEHIEPPKTKQIRSVTTIDQRYWRNDSDELPLHGTDIELGSASHGYVSSRAWATGPGASSYGGAHEAQR